MLTNEAFNALLKTLEEPPEYVLFIMATTEANKVPLTVLSRCQRFDFRQIAPQKVKERLQYIANEENLQITDEALSLIVRRADGGLRDAIGLLDQCAAFSADGNVASEQVLAVIGSLGEENTAALFDRHYPKRLQRPFYPDRRIFEHGQRVRRDFVGIIKLSQADHAFKDQADGHGRFE